MLWLALSSGSKTPRAAASLELVRERLGMHAQQSRIGPDRDEHRAEIEHAPAIGLADEDARRLAAALDASNGVRDRTLDVGMSGVAAMAHVGREVVGTDEHTVDAVHVRDRLEVVETLARFHLHEQAELVVRDVEV